jgi:hypothetical protein
LKYFICALGKVSVGIPAEKTERIIPAARAQDAVCETENQHVFISLPALFRRKDAAAPHGVVLKPRTGETGAAGPASGAMKTALLTPRIDAELEIPEEGIFSLPEALSGPYRHFRGAYCTGENVILILNPETLAGAFGDKHADC